ARLPGSGPRKDFAACVEWVLVNDNSAFTICLAEPTCTLPPNPAPSQPTPSQTELKPDSTADTGPAPTAEKEPASPAEPCSMFPRAPEPNIMSDQVLESETTPVPEGVLMELEDSDGSPAHTEFNMDPGNLLNYFEVNSLFLLPPLVPSSMNSLVPLLVLSSLEFPVSPECPPNLPLPPPLPNLIVSSALPLVLVSPSAHPQLGPCSMADTLCFPAPSITLA
ncbi:hypothetical protein DPX16_10221, partial [Anabarilius grahami]